MQMGCPDTYMWMEQRLLKIPIFVGGVHSDGGLYFGAGKMLDASSFFSGLIDDVRIYDEVLSAEEIEAMAR